MNDKKISTTVYLTQEQINQLKELNQRTKVPVAAYIREGIDLVLREHSDKLPGQLSLVE
ncbi:MAG: transcriptional regulator [Myxococcales bacterium]|nr:transcriptional regulator [Myxococcales bacterium]